MDSEKIKMQVEFTFNEVSKRYDNNLFFSQSAERMVEKIPSINGMKVLDVSTGTGLVAIEVAKKFDYAEIEAIDLSSGMLEQAKNKAKVEGFSNINFKQCDVDKLPYANDTFDVITGGHALFFYPQMEETYKMLCTKIKPGGMFVFSSFTKDAFQPSVSLFLKRLMTDYQIAPPPTVSDRLRTVEQVRELAEMGKPIKIDIEHFPIRASITTEQWWELLNNAGYKVLLDQLTDTQLRELKKNHLEEVHSISNDEQLELNTDTLLAMVSF